MGPYRKSRLRRGVGDSGLAVLAPALCLGFAGLFALLPDRRAPPHADTGLLDLDERRETCAHRAAALEQAPAVRATPDYAASCPKLGRRRSVPSPLRSQTKAASMERISRASVCKSVAGGLGLRSADP